jgi:hypothetical protein
MLGQQPDGTFKVKRLPESCFECGVVLGDVSYIWHGRQLCPKCWGFYGKWERGAGHCATLDKETKND